MWNVSNQNYVIYHLHTDDSLLDSCTKYQDYIDKAVADGCKAIAFTEHGNIYHWIKKKMYCDAKGIKYIHGVECYLTRTHKEKVRDNYHTILLAKNYDGVKEINKLCELATTSDHRYYKPRISFDEFLNINDNVIKISACLASPLNQYRKEYGEDEIFDRIARHYDYYEIQYHNVVEQKEYNQFLYELSKKNNIPLIAGTDTHSLTKYLADCRTILQLGKNIVFSQEDDFDLTYKTYNDLVVAFSQQDCLPKEVVLDAINNTNKMADTVEPFDLDLSFKYPILYGDDDEQVLWNTLRDKYMYKKKNHIIDVAKEQQYVDNIKEEMRVFNKIGMPGFMLFMSEMITWCKNNGIPVGFNRGSVGGSTVAYISDIIDTDPVKWNTVFSRFANEDRKEIGDIDIDVSPSQRQQVFDYIINRFGQEKTAYVLSMGTISDKGTIDLIGRAFRQKATSDSTINKENYSLQHIAEIKKQYDANPDKTKKDNPEIFKYFDGLVDTTVSQSHHPAGIIASPVTLGDNYGCFYDADDNRIMYIDMEEVHEVSLVKYDILGLKNIEILKDTCELAHIPYPQSHKVNWNDEKVFTDLIKSPVGNFQFESQFAFDSLKKFKPKSVQDISLVTAAIRPSGESYRDKLLAHEVNHNPSKQIDDMLANNNGFLTYQEDIIKFLKDICGLSGSEADNIRRAIGRKDKERLDKALPEILEGYCNKSEKPREIAEQEAREFLQIIEDSSNYSFGYNHSIGYSMITYICAMLRCYYPIEFCTAYLNNAKNDEDITNGTELAKSLGFKIKSPVFRHSRSKYMCDKENNTIYQGIGAIKNIGADVGEILYQYKDYEFNSFVDVLSTININKSCLEILIQIGFFREFGDINTLNYIYDVYKKYHKSKTIKKDSLSDFEIEQIQGCFEKETDKQYRGIDNKRFINNLINNADIQKTSDIEILKNQMLLLGYSDIKIETADIHKYMVEDLTVDKYKRPWVSLYNLRCGVSKSGIEIRKQAYSGLNVGDIIIAIFKDKPIKKYMGEDEYGNKQYRNTGQTRRWIWTYRKDN